MIYKSHEKHKSTSKKLFLTLSFYLFLIISSQITYSAPNSNIMIIDSLLKESFSQLFEKSNLKSQDTLNYFFSEMPYIDYCENSFVDFAFDKNIILRKLQTENIQSENYIKIMPLKIDILYTETENAYIRTITLNFNAVEFLNDGVIKNKFDWEFRYSDTLGEMDLNNIENESIPISKGKRNEKKLSFFDKILEPAIIVATSALTVILFFTVRSK